MKYRTAIRPWSNRRFEKLERVDLLIGIPAFNNQDTIEGVIDLLSEGLQKHYREMKALILVADGGSTDDTRDLASAKTVSPSIEKMVTIYRGEPGKASAFRMIFESASFLKCRVCCIVNPEAPLRSTDELRGLIDPLLLTNCHSVSSITPALLTRQLMGNTLAYPLLRSFLRKRVYNPYNGSYSFSGKLASFLLKKQEIWEASSCLSGIELLVMLAAVMEGFKGCQSYLSVRRISSPVSLSEVTNDFMVIMNSYHEILLRYHDILSNLPESSPPLVQNEKDAQYAEEEQEGGILSLGENFFANAYALFAPQWGRLLSEEDMKELKNIAEKQQDKPRINDRLWCRVVFSLLKSLPDEPSLKRSLLESFAPLYILFLHGFFSEVAGKTFAETEKRVERIAEVFEQERHLLFSTPS